MLVEFRIIFFEIAANQTLVESSFSKNDETCLNMIPEVTDTPIEEESKE